MSTTSQFVGYSDLTNQFLVNADITSGSITSDTITTGDETIAGTLTLTGLPTSTLLATDAQNKVVGKNIVGTANQVIVTNGTDINLSLPQNIDNKASPTFEEITLNAIATNSFVGTDSQKKISTRTLQGTANQVNISTVVGPTGQTTTLSTPQSIAPSSDVTFNGVTLSSLSVNSFVGTDANKQLNSRTLQGTTNQVNLSTVGTTTTLSLPQSIATTSTPTFGGLTVGKITQNNNNKGWVLGELPNSAAGYAGLCHQALATDMNNSAIIQNSGGDVLYNALAGKILVFSQGGTHRLRVWNNQPPFGFDGQCEVVSADDYTSSTNSALRVNGGIYCGKQLYVGTNMTVNGLTANSLVATDAKSGLTSRALVGTANQVSVTTGAGTTTLSTPQNIAPTSDVTFNKVTTSSVESVASTLNIGSDNTTQTINIGSGTSLQTVNIGSAGSGVTTINIGADGDIVNVAGNLNYIQSNNLEVKDSTITLNKGSVGTGTARGAGINFRDNNVDNQAYIIVGGLGQNYNLKAPENNFILSTPILTQNSTVLCSNGDQAINGNFTANSVNTPNVNLMLATPNKVVLTDAKSSLVSSSLSESDIATTTTTQTISGAKTFSADVKTNNLINTGLITSGAVETSQYLKSNLFTINKFVMTDENKQLITVDQGLNDIVTIAGNQTITGAKTFTANPTISNPNAAAGTAELLFNQNGQNGYSMYYSGDATGLGIWNKTTNAPVILFRNSVTTNTNKLLKVDASGAVGSSAYADSDLVLTSTDQTINGTKTFSNVPSVPGLSNSGTINCSVSSGNAIDVGSGGNINLVSGFLNVQKTSASVIQLKPDISAREIGIGIYDTDYGTGDYTCVGRNIAAGGANGFSVYNKSGTHSGNAITVDSATGNVNSPISSSTPMTYLGSSRTINMKQSTTKSFTTIPAGGNLVRITVICTKTVLNTYVNSLLILNTTGVAQGKGPVYSIKTLQLNIINGVPSVANIITQDSNISYNNVTSGNASSAVCTFQINLVNGGNACTGVSSIDFIPADGFNLGTTWTMVVI